MKSKSLVAIATLFPTTTLAFGVSINMNSKQVFLANRENGAPLRRRVTHMNLYRSAQQAIADAERICAMEGPNSERCKVAWDIVEELKAADSHDRTKPEPIELNYYPLLEGFDLLSSKVDKQLDELRNLSSQLAEAGAGPEVERLIYASDEMKQILEDAKAALTQYR
jgi:hypothetical protein